MIVTRQNHLDTSVFEAYGCNMTTENGTRNFVFYLSRSKPEDASFDPIAHIKSQVAKL